MVSSISPIDPILLVVARSFVFVPEPDVTVTTGSFEYPLPPLVKVISFIPPEKSVPPSIAICCPLKSVGARKLLSTLSLAFVEELSVPLSNRVSPFTPVVAVSNPTSNSTSTSSVPSSKTKKSPLSLETLFVPLRVKNPSIAETKPAADFTFVSTLFAVNVRTSPTS